MPLQPFEATKKLCERSNWTLSNLELQKHLFLAQLEYMRRHPGRLVEASFEAWDYGPVIPEIYRYVRRFAAGPIENIFHALHFWPSPDDELLFSSYETFKKKTPGQLVALTHKPRGAWDRNFRSGVLGVLIPDADIRREALMGV